MRFLKKLSIVLAAFLAFASCVSNKTISKNEIIELKVENIPEGVLFTFDHIPQNTSRVFIYLDEYREKEHLIPLFTDIKGTQLEQLKKTNKIICPFVQKDHSYNIIVSFFDVNNAAIINPLNAEIIPNNGVHTLNELVLKLNDGKTSIMLSDEPLFPTDIKYAVPKYMYNITITLEDNTSFSCSEVFDNELEWVSFTETTAKLKEIVDALKKKGIQTAENLSAYATAYCRINYENTIWEVGIAKSNGFTISLE